MNQDDFEIGEHLATNEPYGFSLEALMDSHSRVQGATGAGKSRLLLRLARKIIAAGHSFVLIDGKGDLVDSIERDLAADCTTPRRVAIIDPVDCDEYCPGFNILDANGREPYARGKSVLECLKKIFGEEDETKPWLSEIVLNSLVPLQRAGLSVLELEQFLMNDRLREQLVSEVGDARLSNFWHYMDGLPPNEKVARFSAAMTRASLLWSSGQGIKRILGQVRDSLDWPKVMSRGGILLVNANSSRGLDSKAAQLIGTVCFQRIIDTAAQRPKDNRPPTFVMVDEFARFASSDVVEALELLRGFGVHLILAHQYLEQLEQVPGLLGAVDSCAQNRIVFSTSAPDAERLQAELFTGFRPERKVVQEIHAPVFAPNQRWETIESVTRHPEVETETYSESRSYQSGGTSESYDADGEQVGSSESSSTYGSSSTRTTAWTPAHDVRTETPQHITEYEERDQLSSRQLETLEELKEHGREALMRQPPRCCYVQLQDAPAVPVRVAFTEDVPISDRTLELWRRLIYRSYPTAEKVDQDLEERTRTLLKTKPTTYASKRTTLRIAKAPPETPPR